MWGMRWGADRGANFRSWGNDLHGGRRQVVAEVDNVTGSHLDIEIYGRRGGGRDVCEPEHKG